MDESVVLEQEVIGDLEPLRVGADPGGEAGLRETLFDDRSGSLPRSGELISLRKALIGERPGSPGATLVCCSALSQTC